jgi:Arc-like DNA binding domain
MKRKKSDTVQLSKVRMKEELRAKLAQAADQHEVTLNAEIVARLQESFSREATRQREKTYVEKNAEALEWMVGSNESASDLLREIVGYMQLHKDWWSGNGRKQMMEHLNRYIVRDDIRAMLDARGKE